MLKINPNGVSHQSFEYLVTRSELFMLREEGILSTKAYVYFALSLDYPDGAMAGSGIDIAAFCRRWEVTKSDLLIGVAFLEKKGIVELKASALQVEAIDLAERRTRAEVKREAKVVKQLLKQSEIKEIHD